MRTRHALSAIVAFIVLASVSAARTSSPQQEPPKKEKPHVYDDDADHRALIAEAIEKAKRENRRVLIQWGGNWCGWCILLHELCSSDAEIRRKLLYEYDVVLVPIEWRGMNMDLARLYEADLENHGVPFLTVLDSNGRVLVNQETASFENPDQQVARGHDRQKVLDFLTEHQAPYRYAREVLDEGLARAKEENKRVFLHFGAPWCGWCHRLENWMADEDVAEILEKDFVDVKIDIDRTIGGQEIRAHYNPSGGGIPWFAVLDAEGEIIETSDFRGRRGNIGCPWTPEEIEAFAEFLAGATVTMSEEDVESLCKSLAAAREAAQKKRSGAG